MFWFNTTANLNWRAPCWSVFQPSYVWKVQRRIKGYKNRFERACFYSFGHSHGCFFFSIYCSFPVKCWTVRHTMELKLKLTCGKVLPFLKGSQAGRAHYKTLTQPRISPTDWKTEQPKDPRDSQSRCFMCIQNLRMTRVIEIWGFTRSWKG